MRTLKLTLEYDGTRYSGWQQQANAQTIAGELWTASEDFFGRPVEIGGSGRTDAGVHAIAQVASIKFPRWGASPAEIRDRISNLTPQEIIYGLNDRLPADINVLAVEDVGPEFHARHDAKARSYIYQISTRRTAFNKKFVWWVKDRLNVQAMADAAKLIVGYHDFSAFSERDVRRLDESTTVVVNEAEFVVEDHLIIFRISASHYLWKMVRRLVGSLVEVGRGNVSVADFGSLIAKPPAKNQAKPEVKLLAKSTLDPARVTAPPSGLFLEQVTYPEGLVLDRPSIDDSKENVKLLLKDAPPIKKPIRKKEIVLDRRPNEIKKERVKLSLKNAATPKTGTVRKAHVKLSLKDPSAPKPSNARKVHVKLSLKEAAAHAKKSRKQK
ncbi:MAG TPA: tRNA pseudouridine(38-40) synthase TruA [Blastocatellia bacterium]|nr:tRNA pseudouridine(38-40) synthase TruA [Blastocatellia bacterium]